MCTKATGHAEAVEVVYDTEQLSTEALLTAFFTLHDFSVDRREQGGQYRSAIFIPEAGHSASTQEEKALQMLAILDEQGYPASTEVRRVAHFYPAAERHQQYCSARGISPKKRDSAAIREILTLS